MEVNARFNHSVVHKPTVAELGRHRDDVSLQKSPVFFNFRLTIQILFFLNRYRKQLPLSLPLWRIRIFIVIEIL